MIWSLSSIASPQVDLAMDYEDEEDAASVVSSERRKRSMAYSYNPEDAATTIDLKPNFQKYTAGLKGPAAMPLQPPMAPVLQPTTARPPPKASEQSILSAAPPPIEAKADLESILQMLKKSPGVVLNPQIKKEDDLGLSEVVVFTETAKGAPSRILSASKPILIKKLKKHGKKLLKDPFGAIMQQQGA